MQAGDRLGEYVLQELVGEGGFGEVWKAQNPDLPGAIVAIKVPTKPDCAVALRREGALQNVVDHPNVVRTLSVNTANDPPYLVSEYVPGESLRRRLDRVKRMTPRDALEVLAQVLAALGAAHRAGVVHRDVKPENVLLGPDGVAKLSDFGLGRITESVATSMALSRGRSLTEGGGIVGTYHYMSPEQMKGQPVDLRTDLYACGVMLHEMLTGEAHPIRIPVEGVSRAISGIVDQALRTDLLKRFQSATQMLSALEDAVRSSATQDPLGRPIGPFDHLPAAQPVGPFPPRPRSAMLPKGAPSCALMIGIVAAAVIGMTAFMAVARSHRARQELAVAERAMREEESGHARIFRTSEDVNAPDASVLGPYKGGSEPLWVSSLRDAEMWIAVDEFGRGEEGLRQAIESAGAGADCDEASIPFLREAYYQLARADANLAVGRRSSRVSSTPPDQFQAAAYRDSAFLALERAVELGFRDRERLDREKDLTSLRQDPRWNGILNRMNR